MSSRDFLERYLGLLLSTALLVAVAYLSWTGQLTLYMHPRYVWFTVAMAVVATVLSIVAAVTLRPGEDAGHGHDHGHDHDHAVHAHPDDDHAHGSGRSRIRTVLGMSWAVLVLAATIGLVLVAPPSALSSVTAQARTVNSGAGAGSQVDATDVASGQDLSALTVADWASLLHQTSERSFYQGKRASVIGFTSPDPDDPDNVFYLSRFVVTCCAVDAQAVGVPVHWPNWQQDWPSGTWLSLEGGFAPNTSATSGAVLVLVPERFEVVPEPETPYVF